MASSSSSSLSSSLQQQFNDNSENNNNFDLLPRVDFDKTEIVASTKWMRLETLSYLVPNSNNEMASQSPQQQQQQQPRPAAALRKWDRVVRTTKHSETSVDAVVILATLRHSIANSNIHKNGSNNSEKGDEIVCVQQYRPPINAFTLELPAGLIDLEDVTTNTTNTANGDDDDDNDDNNLIQTQEAAIKSAALREFTEETGYIGTISSMTIGPLTYLSPGLTNECACLVKLDVDMTHEQNVRVYNNYMKDISSAHAHDDGDGGENRCANTMEESERERELTTVLFPKVGLLAALQEYVQRKNNDDGGRRENVKLFTGLFSLAVGMSIMEEEMKLLASSSSGGSTTAMTTTASTNLPSLFSPDTNPMLAASSPTTTATTTTTTDFPLVQLQFMDSNNNNRRIPTKSTSHAITSALRTSGFVLIQSPTLFPWELQQRALSAARQFLESEKALLSNKVVSHPSDPKVYAMLQGMDSVCFVDQDDGDSTTFTTTTTKQHDLPTSSLAPDAAAAAAAAAAISASDATILDDLKEWYKAMRQTRSVLLHCLAIGLGMSSSSSSSSSSDDDAQSYFNNLHQENNDALRLIKYHPGDDTTGNRCKEHSDYGTITLLLNDGVAGLEAHVNGKWRAVPYVEGSIVVNVGTLLSEWTRQELKATLHRVAGPASSDSCNTAMEREALMESVRRERISMAYFADPDVVVSVSLSNTNTAAMMKKKEDGVLANDEKSGIETMSVSDYIRWRSGGSGQDRSGVAFTSLEESRLGEDGGEWGEMNET
ncbi:hypothetical protein ACHAWU_007807 [Discostella pseudostelligera]|uniref:Fe2OG dioxygenase domain-containing protein n=1 Tax=Discostella pseudostelligera TaxID=259834 RepID=A0ABD3M961_9STRA